MTRLFPLMLPALLRALLPPLLAALLIAGPAAAAERGYTITSFDRIQVEGPYAVTVTSGKGPSARASGSPAGLDSLTIRVEGRTLLVQRNTSAWGGFPGADRGAVTVAVTVPRLVSATLAGSGDLRIDSMRDARVELVVAGSGGIAVARLETDRLGATVSGSGGLAVAGRALSARIALRGSGRIDGAGLKTNDATILSDGSGEVRLAVERAANVQTTGSGDVAIAGNPACTVRRIGSGNVICGRQP